MKVMSIHIKSEQESTNDFEAAWRAVEKKLPFKKKSGVYFTSLEAVRHFLTPRRLELLHLIKEKHPHSLYELARQAGRSFSSVFRDVDTLTRHGLVKLDKRARSSRRAVCPHVDYDTLDFKIAI